MANIQLRVDDGSHRQATWLELLFDLAFVICISSLAHLLIDHPGPAGLLVYACLLIPTWWVWNQYTWYASHFDNDDIFFRLLMLWGAAGTLFMSWGLREAAHGTSGPLIGAYLFLHLGLLAGWIKADRQVPAYRSYSRLKLMGIGVGVATWGTSAFVSPPLQYALMGIGTLLQLLVPILAWMTINKMISLHHHHLQERHGLFVIILLGECMLALSQRIPSIQEPHGAMVAALFLLILFSVWWVYFDWKYDPVNLKITGYAFAYNYGHLFLYGGLGLIAVGIGLGSTSNSSSANESGFATAGVALFLLALSFMNWLSHRERGPLLRWAGMGAGMAMLLSLAVSPDSQSLFHLAFSELLLLGLIGLESRSKRADFPVSATIQGSRRVVRTPDGPS